MTQYAFRRPEDEKSELFPLVEGDIVDHDKGWAFERVSREAYGHSSGRVQVYRQCPDARDAGNGRGVCSHMWHHDGVETREFFPHVFDLYLGDAQGNQA